MTEIMNNYQKSVRRGELMVARYEVEHPTFDRVADLLADLLAYSEENGIDFAHEVKLARYHIRQEQKEIKNV